MVHVDSSRFTLLFSLAMLAACGSAVVRAGGSGGSGGAGGSGGSHAVTEAGASCTPESTMFSSCSPGDYCYATCTQDPATGTWSYTGCTCPYISSGYSSSTGGGPGSSSTGGGYGGAGSYMSSCTN
jgi:hypothetical protein